jgi:hypothetical protein
MTILPVNHGFVKNSWRRGSAAMPGFGRAELPLCPIF